MGKLKDSVMWPNARDYTATINQQLADNFFKHHNPYTHKPVRNKYNIVGDRVEECRELIIHEWNGKRVTLANGCLKTLLTHQDGIEWQTLHLMDTNIKFVLSLWDLR